jgi:hypothetical protein
MKLISKKAVVTWSAALMTMSSTARADQTICKSSPIPPGMVIVAFLSNHLPCPGTMHNAVVIRTPGDQETVCSASPTPPGYVVIATVLSTSCPGAEVGNNARVIKKVKP